MSMWWTFIGHPKFRELTYCKVGKHKKTTWFKPKKNIMWDGCTYCCKKLSNSQPMDQIP
jgi:hypothetical protein